jgi:hypothetical protein
MDKELPKPNGWRGKSAEILSCWIVDGKLECIARMKTWEDVSTWGTLLADVIDRLSEGLARSRGLSKSEVSGVIFAQLQRSLKNPGAQGVIDTTGETIQSSQGKIELEDDDDEEEGGYSGY